MREEKLTKQELLNWLERVTEKMRDALESPDIKDLKSELRYELARIEQVIDNHKEMGK